LTETDLPIFDIADARRRITSGPALKQSKHSLAVTDVPDSPDLKVLPLRSALADDVVAHAGNLSGWQQRYDQLSGGAFHGALDELWVDEVQVFRERTSRALLQGCSIREDAFWCGVTATHDGSRIDGREVGAGGVMVCGRPVEFELLTPDQHDIFGVVVSRTALEQHAQQQGLALPAPALNQPGWVNCGALQHARLRASLGQLLMQAGAGALSISTPSAQRHLRHAVYDALLDVLATPADERAEPDRLERQWRLVSRVRACVKARRDDVPTVADLCEMFHVSRRTMQYAFEEVLGMSPLACLRSLRLNAVRRELLSGDPGMVRDVATQWGFWNLSQFSGDYRRQFGERPSDTLARSRGCALA
jgi:AraC family ethanolamine operon transcriptional activator